MTIAAPSRASEAFQERPPRSRMKSHRAAKEAAMATPTEATKSVGSYRIIGTIWMADMPQ